MKKLFLYIFLGLLWCNVVLAIELEELYPTGPDEVYYCVDNYAAGFPDSSLDKIDGTIVRFQPQKFKVKFMYSKSKMIMIEDSYEVNFETDNEYKIFYHNGFDETIVFRHKKWEENENIRHYVRSHTLPGDSLYVAQGKCDKF